MTKVRTVADAHREARSLVAALAKFLDRHTEACSGDRVPADECDRSETGCAVLNAVADAGEALAQLMEEPLPRGLLEALGLEPTEQDARARSLL